MKTDEIYTRSSWESFSIAILRRNEILQKNRDILRVLSSQENDGRRIARHRL
jgi:hypothetical protein